MSIALDFFCFYVPLTIRFFTVFYVANIVGGCWCPISDRAVIMAFSFWCPPNSASVSDAITLLIMLHSTFTGPFWGGIDCIDVLDFGPSKKYPPDLLCAYVSEMSYAYE